MLRELAIGFALFWMLGVLATASGWAIAHTLGGQGFRDFFREATLGCLVLFAIAIAVATL